MRLARYHEVMSSYSTQTSCGLEDDDLWVTQLTY